MSSLRAQIKDALKPLLPNTWDIYSYELDPVVKTTRPALVIRMRSTKRLPEAGQSGAFTSELILSLYEPKTDPATREDALEAKLLVLTEALDKLTGLVWEKADKALTGDYLVYDIPLTILN